MQFSELNLSAEMLKAINEIGYTTPSEIQEKSIPLLLEGKDVIGRSNTGTGKTAAFGIPAIESISRTEKRGVEVLILCPTRELAMQACEEIKKFARFMPWIKPSAVYGGANMEKQIFELKRGANIVVGTPGRVMDHIDRKTLKLGTLRMIILDEADEMLNMGFREDIETILKSVPEERQTVLFSATMPAAILNITKNYQKDPTIIKVENKARTVDSIEQFYYEVPMGRKLDALQLLLLMYEPKLAMVFCNTKRMVDELTESLCAKGMKAAGIHGDMKQSQRTQVMDRFKTGRTQILIATDVAARGIDVDDIDAVFNFDLPQDNEYYVHRIGRTGRAGKTGTAYTLISGRKQVYELKDIMRFTKAEITQKALPNTKDIAVKKMDKIAAKIKQTIESGKNNDGLELLRKLEADGMTAETVASALLAMKISKENKALPEFVNSVPREVNRGTGIKVKTVKVDLDVGRQNRIAPNFILGALVDATGLPGKSFGKIDIFDKHTTVEVPEEEHEHVIDAMNNGKINGNKVTVKLYEGTETAPKRPYDRNRSSGAPSSQGKRYSGGSSEYRGGKDRIRKKRD
ncbi:MAG: DEAD/DEAH box helicase [Oscillospiraceae bacterium]